MLIGSRTPEELAALLETGYFVNGKQRITMEIREGARFPKVRLWDDWEERRSHLYVSNLALVLEIARIDLSGWSWHSNKESTNETSR